MTEPTPCSLASVAAGEPAAGSAAEQRWWVFVEVRAPWSVKGFPDVSLPRPAMRQLLQLRRRGFRVQLIRQPGRAAEARRVYALDGLTGRSWRADVPQLAALPELPWDDIAAGGAEALRDRSPAYMVCTHGRRDTCCARLGVGLYRALAQAADPEQVWQVTHLGGHRFAPTILVTPHGICYGRLGVDDAAPLAAAHARGRGYRAGVWRGRCAWPRPAQVAEIALRGAGRAPGLAGWSLESVEASGEGDWTVALRADGVGYRVPVVSVSPGGATIKSCGSEPARLSWLQARLPAAAPPAR